MLWIMVILPKVKFASEGAKNGFEKALSECCDRFGWVLHAHCIIGKY